MPSPCFVIFFLHSAHSRRGLGCLLPLQGSPNGVSVHLSSLRRPPHGSSVPFRGLLPSSCQPGDHRRLDVMPHWDFDDPVARHLLIRIFNELYGSSRLNRHHIEEAISNWGQPIPFVLSTEMFLKDEQCRAKLDLLLWKTEGIIKVLLVLALLFLEMTPWPLSQDLQPRIRLMEVFRS